MARRQITETQLVLPSLIVLSQQTDIISTKTLKKGILKIVKPGKADLTKVLGRDQSIVENRIENLISHRSLKDYVDYKKVGGKFYIRITAKGKTELSKRVLKTTHQ